MRVFEDRIECRNCGMSAEWRKETVPCQFCGDEVPTGHTECWCEDCEREWFLGKRTCFTWHDDVVCSQCASRHEVGACVVCGRQISIQDAQLAESELVCRGCWDTHQLVWCPKCGVTFKQFGYLKIAFRQNRPGLHAAALVTHYRHSHVKSHDRAWSNRHYANAIPGYDYDEYKAKVNNQAKRQLIRAIAKQLKENTYPETAPIDARRLIRGFGDLQENDEKTKQLIEAVIAKVGEPTNEPGY